MHTCMHAYIHTYIHTYTPGAKHIEGKLEHKDYRETKLHCLRIPFLYAATEREREREGGREEGREGEIVFETERERERRGRKREKEIMRQSSILFVSRLVCIGCRV